MSQEEQMLSHGRTVAEYAASKSRLVALRSEARRFAEAAQRVAAVVSKGHPAAHRSSAGEARQLPEPEHMAKLLEDISAEAERLEGLGRQLAALGIKVDEEALRPLA